MSRFPEALAFALIALAAPAGAEPLGLGRPALPAEIAAWDIDIRPDGAGLPPGSGTVAEGEAVYTEQCAACHGDFGEGIGRWPPLAGGADTLTAQRPVKTVGSYWPYLSTVYDYVHRAMPFGNAQSLSDDEVYAVTAYLLYLNWLVEEDFELSRENFAGIEMPNRDGFDMDNRETVEHPVFAREVCMDDCKDAVEITARARVLNVTPDQAEAQEVAAEAGPDPELVAAGEKLFRRCKACHQVGEDARNRSGPHLNDLFGRVAGTAGDFRYSNAMEEKGAGGLVWTEETLALFLADPRGYVPGTRMSFSGFRSAEDIAAVTAYLQGFDEE